MHRRFESFRKRSEAKIFVRKQIAHPEMTSAFLHVQQAQKKKAPTFRFTPFPARTNFNGRCLSYVHPILDRHLLNDRNISFD